MDEKLTRTAALWVVLFVGACGSATSQTASSDTLSSSSNLHRFEAPDIDGNFVDLGDHLGRDVVLLSFWATYCEPCKAEMPVLQALHRKYEGQGLKVISISLDGPETQAEVPPYIKKLGYSFPVIIDEDNQIAQSYNPARSAPFTLIIGRDGTVKKRILGFQASEAAQLETDLVAFLGNSDPH